MSMRDLTAITDRASETSRRHQAERAKHIVVVGRKHMWDLVFRIYRRVTKKQVKDAGKLKS